MSEYSNLNISRRNRLDGTVVIVDGIGRTGKGMICTILSSFRRVEIERLEHAIEWVSILHKLGQMKHEAAVWALQMEADNFLINSMIGRNTNFRYADQSSAWRAPAALRYFRRIFIRDKESVIETINKTRPIFQSQTHNQLSNFKLYYDAFGDRLRFIELIRHPVDVIDAWMRRGFGKRFGVDPLQLTMCINDQGVDIPYLALGWKDTYLTATPMERVVKMIESWWRSSMSAYDSLADKMKEQILFIPFEDFVQHTYPYLDSIGIFIGSDITRYTNRILRRENCPRTVLLSERDKKMDILKGNLSEEYMSIVHQLAEEYMEWSDKFIV